MTIEATCQKSTHRPITKKEVEYAAGPEDTATQIRVAAQGDGIDERNY